jgi:glycosyltransferase involved in cell wall biosynthesis
MESESKNVVIFSSCMEAWGGSEELWSQAAELLAQQGFKIHVYKFTVDFAQPRIKELQALGFQITDLVKYNVSAFRRIWNRFLPFHPYRTLPVYIRKFLAREVDRLEPALFLVSQGTGFDGIPFVNLCPLEKYPYAIVSLKTDKNHWAYDWERELIKKTWQNSARNFFVSEENKQLNAEQFNLKPDNLEVVFNPYSTQFDEPIPWTFDSSEKVRIACPARLYPLDKGQDILLRVLADPKWRQRNLEVSFFGKGANEHGLKDLAKYLKLENVSFRGQVSDMAGIWREHPAIILPSRNEGLPIVLIEAMLCGRVPIVTDVGGNRDVIENNVTGFLAKSVDESGVDEAMERAWQNMSKWEEMGKLAAEKVRAIVPANPAQVFADKLLTIIEENKALVVDSEDE